MPRLTKSGAGTWVLAGSNSYTGDTNINGGTLRVLDATGSGTGAGNVNVNNAGILGGVGIIAPGSGKSVTVASGATLNPGTAAAPTGALKVNGPVILQNGGQFAAALGSNASQTSNSLDLSSGGSINFATGSKPSLSALASGFTNTGGPATYTLAATVSGNGGNILLDGSSLADQQVIGSYG
jgi:autotransporter-associated beta strand protein